MRCSVAAIIPAYNEEKTVGDVARAALRSGVFSEVIVVNDGSSDRTAEAAAEAGARVISLAANEGKGSAMSRGVAACPADLICFLDADLKGLNETLIHRLVDPVCEGKVDVQLALVDRGSVISRFAERLPLWTGNRVLPRALFESVPESCRSGFMIETALNFAAKKNELRVGTTILSGLDIVRKMEKVGVVRGLMQYAAMYAQIIRAAIAVRAHASEFGNINMH